MLLNEVLEKWQIESTHHQTHADIQTDAKRDAKTDQEISCCY